MPQMRRVHTVHLLTLPVGVTRLLAMSANRAHMPLQEWINLLLLEAADIEREWERDEQ